MACFEDLGSFVDLSQRENNVDLLADSFLKTVEPYGIDSFACCSVVSPDKLPNDFDLPSLPKDVVAVTRYSDEWMNHYLGSGYFRVDPTVYNCLTTSLPFHWSDMDSSRWGPQQKAMMDESRDAGIKHGYTVPIHSRFFYSANFSVSLPDEAIPTEAKGMIHLMAIYFHEAAKRSVCSREKRVKEQQLTAREREVMSWVAAGKSDWEMGEILGISENTAHFHVENAKKKFGVASRQQAVIEAFLTTQISI